AGRPSAVGRTWASSTPGVAASSSVRRDTQASRASGTSGRRTSRSRRRSSGMGASGDGVGDVGAEDDHAAVPLPLLLGFYVDGGGAAGDRLPQRRLQSVADG